METCRRCLGGHGYLQAAGIIEPYSNWLPARTYEGEHTVLLLQVSRYLVKCAGSMVADGGASLPAAVSYFRDHAASFMPGAAPTHAPVVSAADWLRADVQRTVFGRRAARLSLEASRMVGAHRRTLVQAAKQQAGADASKPKPKFSFEQMSETATIELVRASRAHAVFCLFIAFADGIAALGDGSKLDADGLAVARALKAMCDLFALTTIEKELGEFTEDGYVTPQQARWLRAQSRSLLPVVRRDAIALVDSWDFSDRLLNSALGRYDGNVYDALFASAGKEPLNRSQVAPGVREHLQPAMRAKM
jgi:acyl-CoA oxidase